MRARIERIYMDGTGRNKIISDNIFWPNGITIDYTTDTLYWVDAKKHTLECSDLSGNHRRMVRWQL